MEKLSQSDHSREEGDICSTVFWTVSSVAVL